MNNKKKSLPSSLSNFIIKISLLSLLLTFNNSVLAEYYMVPSTPVASGTCNSAYQPHVRHHYRYHRARHHRNYYVRSPQISVFYVWPPMETCGCQWQPSYQTCCGANNYYAPQDAYIGNDPTTYTYQNSYPDPDMSTADDNAYLHPNMDIDY